MQRLVSNISQVWFSAETENTKVIQHHEVICAGYAILKPTSRAAQAMLMNKLPHLASAEISPQVIVACLDDMRHKFLILC